MLRSAETQVHGLGQCLQRGRGHRAGDTEFHCHLVVVAHVLERVGETELHAAEIAFHRLARQHLEDP